VGSEAIERQKFDTSHINPLGTTDVLIIALTEIFEPNTANYLSAKVD